MTRRYSSRSSGDREPERAGQRASTCSGRIGSESPGADDEEAAVPGALAEAVGLGSSTSASSSGQVARLDQRVERAEGRRAPARRGGAAAAAR